MFVYCLLFAQVVVATNIAETSVTINGIVYGVCTSHLMNSFSSPPISPLPPFLSFCPPFFPPPPIHFSFSHSSSNYFFSFLSCHFSINYFVVFVVCVVIDCGFVKLKAFSPKTSLGKSILSIVASVTFSDLFDRPVNEAIYDL